MSDGWIKTWRDMEDSVVMSDPMALMIWMRLLFRTNWKDGYFSFEKVKRGEMPFSYRTLASDWKMSHNTIRKWFGRFEAEEMIEIRASTTAKHSILKVVNYERYQGSIVSNGDTVADTDTDTVTDTLIKEPQELQITTPPNPPATSSPRAGQSVPHSGAGADFSEAAASDTPSSSTRDDVETEWQRLTELVRSLGVRQARKLLREARDRGVVASEIAGIAQHFEANNGYGAGALGWRLKHAEPGEPSGDGWPKPSKPSETRSQEAKIEQEAHAAENQIVKAGRKKGVPDEAIREKIRAHFAAQGFPLRFSTWCSEVTQ